MKIDPNAPASPHTVPGWTETTSSSLSGSTQIYHDEIRYPGLTIRAHFAAMAMAAMAGSYEFQQFAAKKAQEHRCGGVDVIAKRAVEHADALIAELNK